MHPTPLPFLFRFLLLLGGFLTGASTASAEYAPRWTMVELEFTAGNSYANPYTEVEFHATFTHESGLTLRRPGFWDGGKTFKVRFASPVASGTWSWESQSNGSDPGLDGKRGSLTATPAVLDTPFTRHGFWRIPFGSRWMEHADGTPAIMVADTPWALPWRATHQQVQAYAADRREKGFNAALLMSVMPDMRAEGPPNREAPFGFARGFEDLPDGHINQLKPEYFQYLDRSIRILVEHGIAPVWQPVFHGFGWKGLGVAGPVIPPGEYARYCRYLVARYGAWPAIWLVLGDGHGAEPGIEPGGAEIEAWDAYRQPTGLHYGPHRDSQAHQGKTWLDFQWIQTGHGAEHRQDRLVRHWHLSPAKAVANGEPTYENIGRIGNAEGWWQGHEAWRNLCAGGTMGVVYGAGSLWNWILPSEPTQGDGWARAPGVPWFTAMEFKGATYVGHISRILSGLPFTGVQPDNTSTYGKPALFKPYELLILYLQDGGDLRVLRNDIPDAWKIFDPMTAEVIREGRLRDSGPQLGNTGAGPRVVIFSSSY